MAHLDQGGRIAVDLVTEAALQSPPDGTTPLDLSRKAFRLLAENTALVLAQRADETDLLNLG